MTFGPSFHLNDTSVFFSPIPIPATTSVLERTRRDLDQIGRRQGMTEVVAALAYRFLKLLRTWLAEIERVTEELTIDGLPLDGRRALAWLRTATAVRQ